MQLPEEMMSIRTALAFASFAVLSPSTLAQDEFLAWGKPLNSAKVAVETSTKLEEASEGPFESNAVYASETVSDITNGYEYASASGEAYGFHTLTTAYGGTSLVTSVELYNGTTATSRAGAFARYGFTVEKACNATIDLRTIITWTPDVVNGVAWYDTFSQIRFGDATGTLREVTDGDLRFTMFLPVGDYWFTAETSASTYSTGPTLTARLLTQSRFDLRAEAVPEPLSLLALGGASGLLIRRRRR